MVEIHIARTVYPFRYDDAHEFPFVIVIELHLATVWENTYNDIRKYWLVALGKALCNMAQGSLDLLFRCNHRYVWLKIASVAMLELLAGTAGTQVVASGQVLAADGLYGLLFACVVTCCLAHAFVYAAMAFLKTLLGAGRLRCLGLANLQLRNLGAHQYAYNSVVDLPRFCILNQKTRKKT